MKRFVLLTMIFAGLPLAAQTYRVGPGDLLKISVTQLEEIKGDYRVDSLGFLNLPLLGGLDVKNSTVQQIQDTITQRLKKEFVNDPQVIIEIVEFNFRPISVIGAVKEPGKLGRFSQNLTLIDAISQVGGVLENASDRLIVIRKRPDGMNENLEISYRELMIEGKPYLNIPLYPGDTVNIPVEKPLVVSVLGEVNRPGEYKFGPDTRLTLLRVIAAAGGFTDYAKRRRLLIKRPKEDGSTEEITVNARDLKGSFAMKDNDIIIVP